MRKKDRMNKPKKGNQNLGKNEESSSIPLIHLEDLSSSSLFYRKYRVI
jgi:hypothetical protein